MIRLHHSSAKSNIREGTLLRWGRQLECSGQMNWLVLFYGAVKLFL